MSHQLKADFSTGLQPSNASKGSVHAGTVTLACSQLPKDSTKSHCVARMSRFSTERSYFLRSHWETGSCLFPPTIPINRKGPWLERKLVFCYFVVLMEFMQQNVWRFGKRIRLFLIEDNNNSFSWQSCDRTAVSWLFMIFHPTYSKCKLIVCVFHTVYLIVNNVVNSVPV